MTDGTRFYILHVVSAVCGDAGKASSCWLHRFTVCFDEIGGFIGYRVPREHPFTRAEHKPFRPDDYRKLDRILRDPEHILSTINTRKPGVDAVSGATVKYVAQKAVRGALYTSKAVWNIAQASGPQQVQSWTLERVTEFDLRAWQAKGEALKLWWFLDHADKSPLPEKTRYDLGYTLLAHPLSDVQAAALRFLNRTKAPFRVDEAMGSRYAQLNDIVKPDFLAWWIQNKHAPKRVVDAVVNDLTQRVTRYSQVTAPALTYLAAAKALDDPGCRSVLRELAEKNPSTYVRKLAKKLLNVK